MADRKTFTCILLQFFAEGGALAIIQTAEGDDARYHVTTNEHDLEDNFYKSETTFNTFEEAFRYMYLRYNLLHMHLHQVKPELIIPIGGMIRELSPMKDSKAGAANDEQRDKEKQAVIDSIPRADWDKLSALLDALSPFDAIRQSERLKHSTMEYIQLVENIREQLYEMNVIYDFGWATWDEGRWLFNQFLKDFTPLPALTLVKLATAIARSDRFNESTWRSSFVSGQMQNILRALVGKYVSK